MEIQKPDTCSDENIAATADRLTELMNTLHRLDRLLTRYEIDTAAQLHVIDYEGEIAQLCDSFKEQIRKLSRE